LCGTGAATLVVGGQQDPKEQLQQLVQSEADVVVCTADRLLALLRLESELNTESSKNRILGNVQVMVMDEVCMHVRVPVMCLAQGRGRQKF
jgi:superfamily II DNA/RNA helicase